MGLRTAAERGSVMSKLEEIREEFKKDRFATDAVGIVIDCAEPGKAVCSLALKPHHMNANNVPMGGAILHWRILPVRWRQTGIRKG